MVQPHVWGALRTSVQIPQRFGTSILRAVQTKRPGTKDSRRGLERNALRVLA